MATEEEIKDLARAIWEKEGCPEGRAEDHWRRAKQFLEKKEVAEAAGVPNLASLSNHLVYIRTAIQRADRTSNYYFHFSSAVAMLAIGIPLAFLTPPITIIYGLTTKILGEIIGLLGAVVIIGSGFDREPDRVHPRRMRGSLWTMVVGVVMILIGALPIYHVPSNSPYIIQVCGLGVFALGILVANFSLRRRAQEGGDLTERFPP
jgi:hypothetical protein